MENRKLIEMTASDLENLMKRAFDHLEKDPSARKKPDYYTEKFASYEKTLETLKGDD